MLWMLLESPRRGEAIRMSTHNVGFYEEIRKIIFQSLSNVFKYHQIRTLPVLLLVQQKSIRQQCTTICLKSSSVGVTIYLL